MTVKSYVSLFFLLIFFTPVFALTSPHEIHDFTVIQEQETRDHTFLKQLVLSTASPEEQEALNIHEDWERTDLRFGFSLDLTTPESFERVQRNLFDHLTHLQEIAEAHQITAACDPYANRIVILSPFGDSPGLTLMHTLALCSVEERAIQRSFVKEVLSKQMNAQITDFCEKGRKCLQKQAKTLPTNNRESFFEERLEKLKEDIIDANRLRRFIMWKSLKLNEEMTNSRAYRLKMHQAGKIQAFDVYRQAFFYRYELLLNTLEEALRQDCLSRKIPLTPIDFRFNGAVLSPLDQVLETHLLYCQPPNKNPADPHQLLAGSEEELSHSLTTRQHTLAEEN